MDFIFKWFQYAIYTNKIIMKWVLHVLYELYFWL